MPVKRFKFNSHLIEQKRKDLGKTRPEIAEKLYPEVQDPDRQYREILKNGSTSLKVAKILSKELELPLENMEDDNVPLPNALWFIETTYYHSDEVDCRMEKGFSSAFDALFKLLNESDPSTTHIDIENKYNGIKIGITQDENSTHTIKSVRFYLCVKQEHGIIWKNLSPYEQGFLNSITEELKYGYCYNVIVNGNAINKDKKNINTKLKCFVIDKNTQKRSLNWIREYPNYYCLYLSLEEWRQNRLNLTTIIHPDPKGKMICTVLLSDKTIIIEIYRCTTEDDCEYIAPFPTKVQKKIESFFDKNNKFFDVNDFSVESRDDFYNSIDYQLPKLETL